MLKILLKSVLLYFLFSSLLFSQIINEIEINGNKRISKESIIVFSKLNTGLNYNENLINNSLKNLYDTNFFEDIDISFSNNKIIINLIENPIIEELNLTGIKEKFLEFIKEKIYLKRRVSFNEFYLKRDINFIQNILKTNGYYFASIKSNFSKNEDLNSVKLNIDIDLGEKARIKNISLLEIKFLKIKNF